MFCTDIIYGYDQPMKLYYVLDPMCSWCWGFRASFAQLLEHLPNDIAIRYVMGGLAVDSDQPMPEETRVYVQQAWRDVHARTGAEFNHDFWTTCQPRRSTYPACRAVIAAGLQNPAKIPAMIEGIQRAYYLQASNPSDLDTLLNVATETGLDRLQFEQDINSKHTASLLQEDFALRRKLGVRSFPSVLIEVDDEFHWIANGCLNIEQMLGNLEAVPLPNP
jgi:putative protein-disulfide isomerase